MIQPRLVKIPMMLILLLWGLQAVATSVLPISLQRMATTADIIFHGRAINNEIKHDQASGRVATFTTFEVIEIIKGDVGANHTIKQIGGELPGSNVRQLIHGVPQFSVGREYVVFLPKVSSLGFASPIGLSQGKFNIQKLNGETIVSNGRALGAQASATPAQVLADTPSAIVSKQPDERPARVQLTDFMQTVRGMVKE